ncbi:hypothetical protein Tco_0807830 [Tanacetum coccineum]
MLQNMTPENRAHLNLKKKRSFDIDEWETNILKLLMHVRQSRMWKVNELRAEKMAKNANPLALVATAQTFQDTYYQSSKSHKSYAPTSKASLPTRSHASTSYKAKDSQTITPPLMSASEEDQ